MDDPGDESNTGKKGDLDHDCNNVDALNLEKADLDGLKGDIVGNTMYSGKWILKTLIALSKVHEEGWSENFEDDLCTLWDMTAEEDVVHFLADNSFFRIAECTLRLSTEPRLTEIIIGIIGNMCCQPTILGALTNIDNLIAIVFGYLSTDDVGTLIQVIRLLQNFVWDVYKNPNTKCYSHLKDCQFLGDSLSFILQSSTNDDLLTTTVELLQSISNVELPDESSLLADLFESDQLATALIESFNQVIPKDEAIRSTADLKFIENWLTIFTNMIQLQIFRGESSTNDITKLVEIILKILKPYTNNSNLLPLEEKVVTCIHDCIEITSWLRNDKNRRCPIIASTVVTIGHQLRSVLKNNSTEENEDTNEAKELMKYLDTYCLETLEGLEDGEILEMYRHCDRDVIDALINAANEHFKERSDFLHKLLHIKSVCLDR